MNQLDQLISTPITYRIRVEYCGGRYFYNRKQYYSFNRAIYAVKMMILCSERLRKTYLDGAILLWLVHFKGEQEIGKQRIQFNLN